MYLYIFYITIIIAVILMFYSKLKLKRLYIALLVATIPARWFMLKTRQEILDYLINQGPDNNSIRYYDVYLLVFVTSAVCFSVVFIYLEYVFKGRYTKLLDKLTGLLIILIVFISIVLSFNYISKFYDSSYIFVPPALRGALIMEISFVIRKLINLKIKKMPAA